MASLRRDAACLARCALSAATKRFRGSTGVPFASIETMVSLGGVPISTRPSPPPHLRVWSRSMRSMPYGAAPRSVPRIRSDGDRDESRGAKAERLRRARIQHEVRMFKEKAKEELSKEHWVRKKIAEGGGGFSDRPIYGGVDSSSTTNKTSSPESDDSSKKGYGANRGHRLSRVAVVLKPEEIPVENQKCIRVGIVGVPNAGKSQLVNTLVGSLVSAVSPKTNTTRGETLACVTKNDTQVLFVDLPGVVGPEHYRNPKHAAKVGSAWAAAASCDSILFIVDAHRQATRPDPRVSELLRGARENLERLRYTKDSGLAIPKSILALNKVDLFDAKTRDHVKRVARDLSSLHPFNHLFPISAKRGAGVCNVLDYFVSEAPSRKWELDPKQTTDKSKIDQAIEVVRECVYQRLHKELPYNVVPLHDTWENFRNGSYKIEQTLVVDSVNVKQIVVGRRGSTIGQIGIRARTILEEVFGTRVHLVLHVKVRKKNKGGGGRRMAGDGDRY